MVAMYFDDVWCKHIAILIFARDFDIVLQKVRLTFSPWSN